jgi:CRISPR-associated protein Cas1
MIKQTVCITTPCHLSVKNGQILVSPRDQRESTIVPLEDVGFVILENHSITISVKLVELLNANNTAIVFCDAKHMPCAMLQPFQGNTTQGEVVRAQVAAPTPLKKQLWKITVAAKIFNQAALLMKLNLPEAQKLARMATSIKSGDPENKEGQAARIYWKALFGEDFRRERFGDYPNNLANYGYAIVRAATARAVCGSGMYPGFSIFHSNKYNAFGLADDVMEPFRPFVDMLVREIYDEYGDVLELSPEIKRKLLGVLTCDVAFPKGHSPLMIALSRSSASLARSFTSGKAQIIYPLLE